MAKLDMSVQRHRGEDKAIIALRKESLAKARRMRLERNGKMVEVFLAKEENFIVKMS